VLAVVVDHLKVEHRPRQQAAAALVAMQLILWLFLAQPIQAAALVALLVVHLVVVMAVLA
jgi:hypothetical protein